MGNQRVNSLIKTTKDIKRINTKTSSQFPPLSPGSYLGTAEEAAEGPDSEFLGQSFLHGRPSRPPT